MALFPVVETCLIMMPARQHSLLTSNAVMQQLGKISYVLIERQFSSFFPLTTINKSFVIVMPLAVLYSAIYYFVGIVTPFRVISQSPQANFIAEYKYQHESLGEDYWLKCDAYKSLLDKGNTVIDPTCISKSGDGGLLLWGTLMQRHCLWG